MSTRARTMVHTMKSPLKVDKKEEIEKQGRRYVDSEKASTSRRCSSRERKKALLEDVDKLKKKLSHEESVHRALERAFTRPLGALPRLPPYLPQHTLELLAEVAVLEEEVVRLEEQVVNVRQGLYEEAVNISSSKRIRESPSDLYENKTDKSSSQCNVTGSPAALAASSTQSVPKLSRDQIGNRSTRSRNEKQPLKRIHCSEDSRGKENESCTNSKRNNKQSPKQPDQRIRTPVKGASLAQTSLEKRLEPVKIKLECRVVQDIAEERSMDLLEERTSEGSSPNKISEEVLKCLSKIFLRMNTQKYRHSESEMFSSVKQVAYHENNDETEYQDPYGICKLRKRDIGSYKHLCAIEAHSIDANRTTTSLFLMQRLKLLLGKLATVELKGLTHQQKLAFWINIYNSCMMNAFLEHGIPESPQKVVALMQKAMINVGGQSLNAMTIEHFILSLPHHVKSTSLKGDTDDEMKKQSILGLEWSEPLITFALSCGSWSSPAVRVYTASQVENELEAAKNDYLQAAVGISSSNKLVIPKLLDWYLLNFAKDLESLLDWICLQLPDDMRNEAIRCLERGKGESLSQSVQVVPYEFAFRYLLHQ